MTNTWGRAAAIAALALALTGCVRVTSVNALSDHDTISQDLIVAFEPAAAEQLGIDLDTLTAASLLDGAGEVAPGVDPSKVTVEDYVDGELRGVRIVTTDLTLEEFNETSAAGVGAVGGGLATAMTVVRDGDEYVITIPASDERDLSGVQGAGSLGLIADSVDVSFTFEFPGPVKSASVGEVDGKRVVVGLEDLMTPEEIVIRGQATNGIAWGPILRWAGIAAAAIVIIGGAALLVWQDKKRSRRNNLPPIPPAPESGADTASD